MFVIGRGDDTVGNPHRARIAQFENFELVLSFRADGLSQEYAVPPAGAEGDVLPLTAAARGPRQKERRDKQRDKQRINTSKQSKTNKQTDRQAKQANKQTNKQSD